MVESVAAVRAVSVAAVAAVGPVRRQHHTFSSVPDKSYQIFS